MPIQRIRKFETKNFYPPKNFSSTAAAGSPYHIRNEFSMAVRAGNYIFLRGQTGFDLEGNFHGVGDAAKQAEVACQGIKQLLEEAGSSIHDVCKIKVYLTDRAYRSQVYAVIGEHFKGVYPCSTGLVVKGLALPEMLVEIDVEAVASDQTGGGSKVEIQRIRKFETKNFYPPKNFSSTETAGSPYHIRNEFCMAVRAGNRIFLRGQTGFDLEGNFHGVGDAAKQAEVACQGIKQLLEEAGGSINDICKITVYLTDRAYRSQVYAVIGEHLRGVYPCSTGLVVEGLALPEMLVEIDVEAVVSDAADA
jgi:enamine deaminase RidA (YjgF/YER057c/UK114 family)